jgi:hypothetical protein
VGQRVGAVPWSRLVRGGMLISRRWGALSAKERARLASLVRQSRGSVSNLSRRQKLQLRKLVRKLDLKGLGRELAPLVRGDSRRDRRGRRGRR